MKKHPRRSLVGRLAMLLVAIPSILEAIETEHKPKYRKVRWEKIGPDQPIGPGDFWASHDPNTPERQWEGIFNLQMQASHPMLHGKKVQEIHLGNGAYWRPIEITPVF